MKIEAADIPFTLTADDNAVFSSAMELLTKLYKSMRDDSSITCADIHKDIVCNKQELLDVICILNYFSDEGRHNWCIEKI